MIHFNGKEKVDLGDGTKVWGDWELTMTPKELKRAEKVGDKISRKHISINVWKRNE